jgi:hypothetical protein
MRNRYSTLPAAVVSILPAFAVKTQLVSTMAKCSSSTLPRVSGVFVAHQFAKHKKTMKAGQNKSRKTGFSLQTFRTLSEKCLTINRCNVECGGPAIM